MTSRAGSATTIQDSVDEVRQIMRGRHHLSYAKKTTFAIETSDSFSLSGRTSAAVLFRRMIAISSISLVVGGIVIMNIMLVSVTERTREIGFAKLSARAAEISSANS